MSERSVRASAVDLDPADLAQQTIQLALYFDQLKQHFRNQVQNDLKAGTPSTPSSQITGAGATTWNVNVAAGLVVVNGQAKEFAAEADRVIHDTTQLVTNGQSCVAAIVAKNASGTISLVNVKGTAATTGSQVAPTDAAIDAAVSNVPWVKICECTINRTADTTVTQSQDNTKRPVFGVTVDTNFGTLVG